MGTARKGTGALSRYSFAIGITTPAELILGCDFVRGAFAAFASGATFALLGVLLLCAVEGAAGTGTG